jgi:hypothetical protein
MDKVIEQILQRRMHGLYLSRKCDDIVELSRELLGLHCWFHRNVAFSALIRGAELAGWKNALTKTWIHHALHGVAPDDLPTLLAVNGQVAGLWNIKKGEPTVEFFTAQPKRIKDAAFDLVENICWQTRSHL